jgi:hypothetical protein
MKFAAVENLTDKIRVGSILTLIEDRPLDFNGHTQSKTIRINTHQFYP